MYCKYQFLKFYLEFLHITLLPGSAPADASARGTKILIIIVLVAKVSVRGSRTDLEILVIISCFVKVLLPILEQINWWIFYSRKLDYEHFKPVFCLVINLYEFSTREQKFKSCFLNSNLSFRFLIYKNISYSDLVWRFQLIRIYD
jgi:hypothetical protein